MFINPRRRRREKVRRVRYYSFFGGLLLGAASVGLMAGAAALYLYYLPSTKKPALKKYPYALLLGCPSRNNGSYSTSQKARCNLAIQAWNDGLYDQLIISGAAVKNQYVECEQMAKYIQARCPAPIVLEDKARTTWQNLENTRRLIGDEPILILTSDLHARRASAMAASFFSHYALLTYQDRKIKHIVREIPSRILYIRLEMEKQKNALKKRIPFMKAVTRS